MIIQNETHLICHLLTWFLWHIQVHVQCSRGSESRSLLRNFATKRKKEVTRRAFDEKWMKKVWYSNCNHCQSLDVLVSKACACSAVASFTIERKNVQVKKLDKKSATFWRRNFSFKLKLSVSLGRREEGSCSLFYRLFHVLTSSSERERERVTW